MILTAMLALATPAPAPAQDETAAGRAWGTRRAAITEAMLRRLDLTSFPNSTGPRRSAGKRTPTDYGFIDIQAHADGWVDAAAADGSWQIGAFLLHDGARTKRLCFTDTALNGGTYRSATAIEVARVAGGLWQVTRVVGSAPGCASR